MVVLEIKNLTKRYGKFTALDNLNLTIDSGNVYGLLGPNGSGKTTTLGVILGILAKSSGEYQWFGGEYGNKYRTHIGAILETPNFHPHLRGEENLRIIAHIKGMSQSDFDRELEIVNLLHRKDTKFSAYSLGMKQRLAIAATLIGDPDVVIFDEPTNGLDPQGIAEVRHILKRVADSGKTVILASHILDEVEKICSHVCIIKDGRLLATGPVGSILSKNTIQVELAAADMPQLQSILQRQVWFQDIHESGGIFTCVVSDTTTPAEINRLLFDNGIVATHLVARKRRLEEEFLEITSKAQ